MSVLVWYGTNSSSAFFQLIFKIVLNASQLSAYCKGFFKEFFKNVSTNVESQCSAGL